MEKSKIVFIKQSLSKLLLKLNELDKEGEKKNIENFNKIKNECLILQDNLNKLIK